MKVARFILKLVAVSLAVAAAACCVVAYWDKIVDAVETVRNKCGKKVEYADYADWDE